MGHRAEKAAKQYEEILQQIEEIKGDARGLEALKVVLRRFALEMNEMNNRVAAVEAPDAFIDPNG